MLSRLNKLKKSFKKEKIDAFFISNQENIAYLQDFFASPLKREIFLLVTRKKVFFFISTNSYQPFSAKKKSFFALKFSSKKDLINSLKKILAQEKIKVLGVEKEDLTLGEYEFFKEKIKACLAPSQNLVENLRLFKESQEIEKMKKAALLSDLAFSFIKKKLKSGISEKDLALELEFFIKKKGGELAFPPIIAFNKNAAIPHYLPSEKEKLKPKSLILLDFGAKIENYCSDITRVLFFGKPPEKIVKIYQTVIRAQTFAFNLLEKALQNKKTKSRKIWASNLDKQVKEYLQKQGFPPFFHGLGHGIGLAIHEKPSLKIDSQDSLQPGMVFTIEPGIYLEGFGGVRIEDMVLLKENRIEILTKSPKNFSADIIL